MNKVLMPLLFFVSFTLQSQSIHVGVPNANPNSKGVENKNDAGNVFIHKPLFKCIEESLKTPIEWQSYPILRLVNMVENNQLDVNFPLVFNDERDQRAYRSEYVNDGSYSWISKDESIDMTDLTLNVGTMRGSAQHSKLLAMQYKHIYLANEHRKLFTLLMAGKLKLIVVSKLIIDKYMLEHPEANLTVKEQFGFKVGFYMSPKFHANSADKFNQAIKDCRHLFQLENKPFRNQH